MGKRRYRRLCSLLLALESAAALAQAAAPAPGTGWHAFADPRAVDRLNGFERRMHAPAKDSRNPLLKADRGWEGGALFVNGGPAAAWDDRDQLFKIWYFTYTVTPKPGGGWVESFVPSFATSRDGVHWDKPALGQVERGGSRANNLLDWPSQVPQGGTNVYLDARDPDPRRRYKSLFYSHRLSDPKSGRGLYVSFSPDGVHWHDHPSNPVLREVHDTHTIFGWDEGSRKYIAYLRPRLEDSKVRVVGRSESEDFVHWSDPGLRVVLRPDAQDLSGTEFYGMPVARFAAMFYGLVWVYHNTPHWPWPKGQVIPEEQLTGLEQTVDAQLVTSPDGFEWRREGGRASFLPTGGRGEWDDGMVYPTTPIEVGDEVWIYYGGFNVRHTLESLALMGKTGGGRPRGAGIGLARLRRDGFVSLHAGEGGAELSTAPVVLDGHSLLLNADAHGGSIRIEIQNPSGRAIPGLSLDECQPIRGDSVRLPVHWRGAASLTRLAGRTVRLRIEARQADLYGFGFPSDAAGSAQAWNLRGVARDQAGDYSGAVEAFERAIQLDPANPHTYFNLGHCRVSHGDPAEALLSLGKSLRLGPSQARVHGDLAAAYAALGKFQQAADQAAEQVRLSPGDAAARVRWGEILSNLGLFEKALGQFQTAAAAEPADSLAILRVGQTLKLLGCWQEAADALGAAAKSGREAEALAALGEIRLDQGDAAEAMSALQRASALNPSRAETWYDLARCEIRRGDWPRASAHLQHALELNPDYTAARYQLGRVYRELGDTAKADEQFQAFRRLEAREREQRKSMKRQY
jgi:tetratricopeptide (TPR) repeat protein